jgi:hypothetical protein
MSTDDPYAARWKWYTGELPYAHRCVGCGKPLREHSGNGVAEYQGKMFATGCLIDRLTWQLRVQL